MGSTSNTGKKAAIKNAATPKDYVNWFEIPAYDLGRAKIFFDHVFSINMDTHHAGEYAMAYFPSNGSSGGAVVQGPGCIPSDCGALLYLSAGNDLDGMLARVEEAGGRVVMGRTLISESAGSFALIVDSEGNRLALHEKPGAATRPLTSKAVAKASTPKTKKAAVKRKAAPKKAARKGR